MECGGKKSYRDVYQFINFWAVLAHWHKVHSHKSWLELIWIVCVGNFDDGFWLIQKLDHFANKLKNPIILWSKIFIKKLFGYDDFLKLHFFMDFSP